MLKVHRGSGSLQGSCQQGYQALAHILLFFATKQVENIWWAKKHYNSLPQKSLPHSLHMSMSDGC